MTTDAPAPKDWVYRFTYDDLTSIIPEDEITPALLEEITKALDNSQIGEEFYQAVLMACIDPDRCQVCGESYKDAHADGCEFGLDNQIPSV